MDAGVKTAKPSYSTTKRAIWLNSICAWAVIILLAIGAARDGKAVEFGTIAMPSMVFLIAAMLGIHRHYGSSDMKTITNQTTNGDQT